MRTDLTAEEADEIRRNFKGCSGETVDAILKFRQTGDASTIPFIVRGVLRRYLRAEARDFIESAGPETLLSSLGVDSLTMLEVMLDVQDALDITVEDPELKRLQTISDLNRLLTEKTAGSAEPAQGL